ncbi:MAG: hypothetical protein ACOCQR_02835 [bacterium]
MLRKKMIIMMFLLVLVVSPVSAFWGEENDFFEKGNDPLEQYVDSYTDLSSLESFLESESSFDDFYENSDPFNFFSYDNNYNNPSDYFSDERREDSEKNYLKQLLQYAYKTTIRLKVSLINGQYGIATSNAYFVYDYWNEKELVLIPLSESLILKVEKEVVAELYGWTPICLNDLIIQGEFFMISK